MKKLFFILPVAVLLVSCEKDINISLPEPEKKIVVDGGISTGEVAEINLTWSTGYFDPVDSSSLASYLITSATVTVTDGSLVDTLQLSYDANRPIPIVWKGNTITGQQGHTYTLNVTAEGKTVSAVTSIHAPIPLDSTWFMIEGGKDSLGFAWAHLTDPPETGNAYRWFAKREGVDPGFIAPFGSTFDDKFVNGKSFDFAYNRPSPPNSTAPEDNNAEAGYYKVGDTIVVKFCTIGQAESDFFRTYEVEVSNNGNPFASPGVIKTNVTNGLGIWCGYAPTYDTIVCHP
ncbi:MAG TPA: DUF4249 domain-containing protein [Bacteroidia bacterium]|nr:DUF4249 domain-containing protein [Bacteroidia bacterium]